MADNNKILARLKKLKDELGMTSLQIAEKSNLSETTVARLFLGEISDPTIASIIQILNAMGVDETEFFDGYTVDILAKEPQTISPLVD